MRHTVTVGLGCGLVAIVVLSFAGAEAAAQHWWWPPGMSVNPPNPTVDDVVTITLSGEWPDSCVPNDSQLDPPAGALLYFDLVWGYPPETLCADVITPWERAETAGPLPVGTYGVYAALLDLLGMPIEPSSLVGTFVVRSAWERGDMNCDGAVDFADINPFVLALGGQTGYEARYAECRWLNADFNDDGSANFADINPFVAALSGARPHIGEQGHSDCLRTERTSDIGCEFDDEIELTVAPGSLHVLHRNATYNCCLDDIVVRLMAQGHVLRFNETEVLSMPCLCVCCYEVQATVINLAPGTYTVEYCWDDYDGPELRCDVQEIEIH